jgi:hypothetical protein
MQIKDDIMNKRSLWLIRSQRNFGRALHARANLEDTQPAFNSAQP